MNAEMMDDMIRLKNIPSLCRAIYDKCLLISAILQEFDSFMGSYTHFL